MYTLVEENKILMDMLTIMDKVAERFEFEVGDENRYRDIRIAMRMVSDCVTKTIPGNLAMFVGNFKDGIEICDFLDKYESMEDDSEKKAVRKAVLSAVGIPEWVRDIVLGHKVKNANCARKAFASELKIVDDLRDTMLQFVIDDEVEKESELVYALLHPDIEPVDFKKEEVQKVSAKDLPTNLLFVLISKLFGTITCDQMGDIVVLKYGETIFLTGWHKAALLSRGKAIDFTQKKIVGYPFDKFFNIGEREDYSVELIRSKLRTAKIINVTDKKDGSLISVTKLEDGDILVNTNGSLDNMQIEEARKYLTKNHGDFIRGIEPGVTYIFELITPKELHIVDYHGDEKMYLIGARNLSNYRLLQYSEMEEIAGRYGLNITEQCEYGSLDEFLEKSHSENENKEGWVFKITDIDGSMFLFKLKYDTYFQARRLRASIDIRKVYALMMTGAIDGALAMARENERTEIIDLMEEINIIKHDACDSVAEEAETLLKDAGWTLEDFKRDALNIERQKKIEFIQKLAKRRFGAQLLKYIKFPELKYTLYDGCTTVVFDKLLEARN